MCDVRKTLTYTWLLVSVGFFCLGASAQVSAEDILYEQGNIVIEFGTETSNTDNCGWYGCRVLHVDETAQGSVTTLAGHGSVAPPGFIFSNVNGTQGCLKYGDLFTFKPAEHPSLTATYDNSTYGLGFAEQELNQLNAVQDFYIYAMGGTSKTGDCVQFEDQVYISLVPTRGQNTPNCGPIGCRIMQLSDPTSQTVIFGHGLSAGPVTLQKSTTPPLSAYVGPNAPPLGIKLSSGQYISYDQDNNRWYAGTAAAGGPGAWSRFQLVRANDYIAFQLPDDLGALGIRGNWDKSQLPGEQLLYRSDATTAAWSMLEIGGTPSSFGLKVPNKQAWLAYNPDVDEFYEGASTLPTGWAKLELVAYSPYQWVLDSEGLTFGTPTNTGTTSSSAHSVIVCNSGTEAMEITKEFSLSRTNSFTLSFEESLGFSQTFGLEVDIPLVTAHTETSFTANFTNSKSWTKEVTQAYNDSVAITVSPGAAIQVVAQLKTLENVEIPVTFTTKVQARDKRTGRWLPSNQIRKAIEVDRLFNTGSFTVIGSQVDSLTLEVDGSFTGTYGTEFRVNQTTATNCAP